MEQTWTDTADLVAALDTASQVIAAHRLIADTGAAAATLAVGDVIVEPVFVDGNVIGHRAAHVLGIVCPPWLHTMPSGWVSLTTRPVDGGAVQTVSVATTHRYARCGWVAVDDVDEYPHVETEHSGFEF